MSYPKEQKMSKPGWDDGLRLLLETEINKMETELEQTALSPGHKVVDSPQFRQLCLLREVYERHKREFQLLSGCE